MHVSATDSLTTLTTNDSSDPSIANAAAIDKRFAQLLADTKDATDTLAEITKEGAKGYWNWKIKEMKKQITDDVMNGMNMTPEKLAQMSAKDRVDTESKILKIVEERLKLAFNQELMKKQNQQLSASATMGSILQNTQDIAAM